MASTSAPVIERSLWTNENYFRRQAAGQCHHLQPHHLCRAVPFRRQFSSQMLSGRKRGDSVCDWKGVDSNLWHLSSNRSCEFGRKQRKRIAQVRLAVRGLSESAQAERPGISGSDHVGSLDRFPDKRLQSVAQPSSTPLLFLDHIRFQWDFLRKHALDLVDLPVPSEIALQTSTKGKCGARVENWAFQSDKMRRVRMTYFYSGDGGQAYNCLVYPDTRFDIPLLGVDLICLGKDRILYVIDFQPLQMSEDYLEKHTGVLAPIHEQYVDLIGHMSAKHFDEAQFFSKRMLFVRTGDTDLFKAPDGRLFRALVEYLAAYQQVLEHAVPNTDPDAQKAVKAAQDAYDIYSEKRDPAIGLFKSYFGSEWAESFTKDFLFPGSRTAEE